MRCRLYHELANPRPGFPVIPILKGVVGQLLAFFGPAIQQLYNIIAGKTAEQATESNSRLPREGIEPASPVADGQNKIPQAEIEPRTSHDLTGCTNYSTKCVLHIQESRT